MGGPARAASVGVKVDCCENAPIRAANGKCHMVGAQQVVPIANLVRVRRLAKAHQRKLGQDDLMGKGLSEKAEYAAFVGVEYRPR